MKLRVDMLLENSCERLAANLIKRCLNSQVFHNDIAFLSLNLVLSHRRGMMDHFRRQVRSKRYSSMDGMPIDKLKAGGC